MISKPSFATALDMVEAGSVTARMGNTIGSDSVDPRFTEFQVFSEITSLLIIYEGLTKITFDGESFSEPEFFTDAWDTATYYIGGGSWLNEINHNWLITSLRNREESVEPVGIVHDVSSGML